MAEIAIEMREAIARLAGERGWNDTRESWLARAARRAGIKPRMARSLFYEQVTDPKYSIVVLVRAAVERLHAEQKEKAQNEWGAVGMPNVDDRDNSFVPHVVRTSANVGLSQTFGRCEMDSPMDRGEEVK